ncbi:RagB/SusD family nutrient uptake outer membrane protein [Sunxiuqinia sp. A32]|uniref:RagB/SusD family nutrient uptake outer membrane protein n=1 Tax=Sunxiuqinia sp. A32 TaxID=3461496 RepID=UPI0040466E60
MKNIKFIYLFISGILLFGCHDILDVTPYSTLTADSFYQSATDLEIAVTGVYDVLGDKGSGYYNKELLNLTVLLSDEAHSTRQNERAISEFNLAADNKFVQKPWEGCYLLINRANSVVDAGEKMDESIIDLDVRDRYLGEVKFLRALSYFHLVRLWNEIPLKKHATSSIEDVNVPLSGPQDVYDFIVEDLEFAVNALPVHFGGNDLGRADQAAAKALLAKVYLTMAGYPLKQTDKYELARDLAKDLIDNRDTYGLGLWSYYGDAFEIPNDNGKEDIFDVQYSSTIGVATQFEGNKLHKDVYQLVVYSPSTYLKKQFETGDAREPFIGTNITVNGTIYKENNKKLMFLKWVDKEILIDSKRNTQVSDQDFKVIRFAEVYLIAAEAENEINSGPTADAYQWVNTIRARARMDSDGNVADGVVPDLADLDQDSFRAAVLKERFLELHCEGTRWYDLVRTETVTEQIEAAEAAKSNENFGVPTDVFLPIPYDEYSRNEAIN